MPYNDSLLKARSIKCIFYYYKGLCLLLSDVQNGRCFWNKINYQETLRKTVLGNFYPVISDNFDVINFEGIIKL